MSIPHLLIPAQLSICNTLVEMQLTSFTGQTLDLKHAYNLIRIKPGTQTHDTTTYIDLVSEEDLAPILPSKGNSSTASHIGSLDATVSPKGGHLDYGKLMKQVNGSSGLHGDKMVEKLC
ncbi:hypothetical protein CONCODRAFT_9011 [Conidiobolus coronatus NRRL 28638]|uniref:Uncharacterized protein n=1 Tax=Conidiobolus coronatus (strain ATCC 28846 / CBS 209.66 / NRRL 28638) TaxID=796925 RepID=A0A137P108_CONC2|nr:hypothetical protein CONCODRAFT_9011 [Conidiobolus coronatus NRRL 28638]|eukprot:KXN68682.1 hypothetical protein CONCODRAFT_9011 [Conidiobolus coronatus NRRL 28638]